MKLYHFPISPNSRRVVALLHHLNLPCDMEVVDLSKGEQMQPEFLTLNPNHMIPTLVDGDFTLWESNAILQYLCSKVPDNSLFPSDAKVQADINRWLFWLSAHYGNACSILIFERVVKKFFNLGAPDATEISKGEEKYHRFAKVLNGHLKNKEWLVGNNLTIADFSVGSFLDLADLAEFPLESYAEIKRWYSDLEKVPAWQSSKPAR